MLFVLGPCITLTFALLGWAIIPFGEGLAIFDFELGVFFALAVSSLGGYGILISGWSANSKYAFLGAIRATAQLLSYELVFSSIVLILILFSGSFSLTYIVECQQAVWNIFPLMPIALAFFIAILAETNRPPFDLAEAESELVAGLCELWLNFFLTSLPTTPLLNKGVVGKLDLVPTLGGTKSILQVVNGHQGSYWAHLNKGLNTISWVLGLMQYRNNNLDDIIGIVSGLYCKLIKYVDKIINPSNGNFCYKKGYYNFKYPSPSHLCVGLGINKPLGHVPMVYLILLNNKLYTWTSKIMGPSERYTPCVERVSFENDIKIHNICPYSLFNKNKGLFLIYISIPGNPMFNSLSLNAKYTGSVTSVLFAKGTDNNEGKIELQTKLEFNGHNNLNYERTVSLYNKRITSEGNYSQNMAPELCQTMKKGSNKEVKRKITEKNKTKSRSNKWKYIISEKSRKHIILGCEGKTYLEKLENFYKSWWNYYIIRKCNTSEILYEYHSPIQDKIRLLHSRFKPPYEEFPNKINEFLNYSDKFRNYNIEKRIGIINDNKIDEYTELYMYFNNGLRVEENNADYFKLDYDSNNESKYIESNIEQYYSFCNNISVYVGWVSIIRINNYSAQPTYYNNLIKRYHKEWINMLKYWVDIPNNNMKWNSNTKMNYTNLLAITTNRNVLPYPFFYKYRGIGQDNNCGLFIKNGDMENIKTLDKLKLAKTCPHPTVNRRVGGMNLTGPIRDSAKISNLTYEPGLFEPFIPNKYQHKFNSVEITIKEITKNADLSNKYTEKGWHISQANKLPWGIKELIMDDIEKHSREFVKIRPKFK
jgi:hypothetical protein